MGMPIEKVHLSCTPQQMEELQYAKEGRKFWEKEKETPCKIPDPCLSSRGRLRLGRGHLRVDGAILCPSESSKSQPAALQNWQWEVMGWLQEPYGVHEHEWKTEINWAWTPWVSIEVSTAQGKWTPSLRLGRRAQTDQRKLFATELRVTATAQW